MIISVRPPLSKLPDPYLGVVLRLRILVILHALYINRRPVVLETLETFLLHSRQHARRAQT